MKDNFLKIFILVVACCLEVQFGYAQQLHAEDLLLEPSALLQEELSGQNNQSYVKQIGDDNEVEVIQSLQTRRGSNLARLLQTGKLNLAIVRQAGGENQLALIQNGSENFYELTLQGQNNNFAIIQNGNGNRIIQDLKNVNNLNVELIQNGNDNEIIQVLSNISDLNFKVIQEGNGLRLRIEQSSF